MSVPVPLRVFYKTLTAFGALVMSKSSETVFYAVGRGKQVGIYDTWKECKAQTEGIPNAKYRKFYSYEDAEEFVNFWKNYSTPVKDSILSENLVSKTADCGGCATNRRRWTHRDAPSKSAHSFRPPKKSKTVNHVLGTDAAHAGPAAPGPPPVRPYTSPLSAHRPPSFPAFPTSNANNHLTIPPRTPNATPSPPFPHAGRHGGKSKPQPKGDFDKPLPSTPPSPEGSSGGPQVVHLPQPLVASVGSAVASNGSANGPVVGSADGCAGGGAGGGAGGRGGSGPCSGLPCDGCTEEVLCTGKKEVVEVSCVGSSGESDGQVAEVSDKLTLCLSLLASVLSTVTQQSTNVTEKARNFLESLLGERITNIHTNTDVNPQMEPQGNVDMICEDTKNFDKVQPLGSQAPEAQGLPASEPQSSPLPQCSFAQGRLQQKNADILALNLRLDSFEKRFDACLKEIGAIAAEISHIKSEMKELKESVSSSPKKEAGPSPSKGRDGRLQTTLCFAPDAAKNASLRGFSGKGSGAESEASGLKEGRSLKRKLSRSNSAEKSKRFADDDIDDLLSRIKTEKVDYTSFTLDEDEYVEVYTDGSALSNGKGDAKAGIGIWFGDNHPLNVAEPVVGPPTNNTAEIQAARVAIQLAIKAGITKLKIHTDSEFLINCATKWIHRWKTNGWTLRDGGPVKNKKELEKLDKAASKISVRWEKVPAHSNIKGNETADRLANEGAARYER